MKASSIHPTPVDDLRCPRCHREVVWTVHGGVGHLGTAYCSNGRQVTRMANQGPYCRWIGQRVVRRADNEVYAVPELRDLELSLEDQAYLLFNLGRQDGLDKLKARVDDGDKPEPSYARGLEQGRAERAARVRDERIARRGRS